MIPVNEPLLDGNEKKYLVECIDTGWISSEGPFVKQFEEQFAARVGRKHGIAVCNGTAALDAAVEALGLGPGDEVIMPTFTIISCVSQIVRAGRRYRCWWTATRLPGTWMSRRSRRRITPRTKAIMVVHIYGLPVDMDPVLALRKAAWSEGDRRRRRDAWPDLQGPALRQFRRHQHLQFLPQQAHHHRRRRHDRDRRRPRWPRAAAACATSAFSPSSALCMSDLGWNFRMTNLQAALGVAQLERLDEFVRDKRRMGARYTELLSGIAGHSIAARADRLCGQHLLGLSAWCSTTACPFDAKEAMARLAG